MRTTSRRDWTKPKPSAWTLLREVTVCSSCKRASCALCVFPCQAPTRGIRLPVSTLRFLDREMEWFWSSEAHAMHRKEMP